MAFLRKTRKEGEILMLLSSQTDTEAAALYWRPNLRLARPGRVQEGEGEGAERGREDQYQPLSPPPLDTTRNIDSLSLNQQTPPHTSTITNITHLKHSGFISRHSRNLALL